MTKQEEIQRLLAELKASNNDLEQRRIRRELRRRGHYLSRDGQTRGVVRGVFVAARRVRSPSTGSKAGTTARDESPTPYLSTSVVTTLRLPADLHRRLGLLAADEGKSANAIIEDLLRKHLDQQGIPSRLKRER